MCAEWSCRARTRHFDRRSPIGLIEGDLVDPRVARTAVQSCEVVYNAVRRTGDYGTCDLYEGPNVPAAQSILAAAIDAGLRRMVHAMVHASSYVVSMAVVPATHAGGRLARGQRTRDRQLGPPCDHAASNAARHSAVRAAATVRSSSRALSSLTWTH